MSAQRNSSIELLRIVCMLMVMLLHFNNHCANPGLLGFPTQLTGQYTMGYLIECFCIVAVNCFVLISGYFGIRLKISSVLRFYLQCMLIQVVAYLIYIGLSSATLQAQPLLDALLVFSKGQCWFIVSYLCLMLVSPLLNAAVDALSKKQLLSSILLMGICVLYFGWYHDIEPTRDGYSFVFFVFLYLIGRYMGQHISHDWIRHHRWQMGIGYIVGSLLLFGLLMLRYHHGVVIRNVFHYDHPLVVINACFLLLMFLSFDFSNKTVNWIAGSVFAAYLFQENIYLGDLYIYPTLANFFEQLSYGRELALLGISIVFVGICVLLDKLIQCIIRALLKLLSPLLSHLEH
ncbi:MAG: acyltransferase [Paludibacteraceae bacterium]|nr:acyltransferase [Paludibacteraceae bacterium]